MNTTRILVAALLLSGITMNASETLHNESTPATLQFRKHQPRDVFKLNTSGFRSSSARDWDLSEVTGGGLFINIGVMLPSKKYLNPYYESGDPKFGIGFDFEFGNFFRFAKIEEGRYGIGLRATWLSLNYTGMTDEADRYIAFQISPVRVGPQFSYAINEKMGADVFYQIGFNYTQEIGTVEILNKDITVASTFLGASHEIGAGFHYKVFNFGLGYRFGKMPLKAQIFDDEAVDKEDLDDKRYSINSFRICLGFKF